MKIRKIPYSEFRRFLLGLGHGYKEATTDKAHVFHRAGKDMLLFRLYRDDEAVSERDLLSTRTFLDWWGYLEPADFDAFLERATTSA
jgi:hypothetical protein